MSDESHIDFNEFDRRRAHEVEEAYAKLQRELATVTKERDGLKCRVRDLDDAVTLNRNNWLIDSDKNEEKISTLRSEVERLYALLDKLGYERLQKVFVDPAPAKVRTAQAAGKECESCGDVGPWLPCGQFDSMCPNCGGKPVDPSQVGGNDIQSKIDFTLGLSDGRKIAFWINEVRAAQATIAGWKDVAAQHKANVNVYYNEALELRTENAALRGERDKLSAIRAKFVLDYLSRIYGECGHDKDEDGNCGNCLRAQLATATAEREQFNQSCLHQIDVTNQVRKDRDSALAGCAAKDILIQEVVAHWYKHYEAELESCEKQITACKLEGDIYGVNFHQGRQSGLVSHDIALDKLKRALSPKAGSDYVPKGPMVELYKAAECKIRGMTITEYLELQFPAVAGHIPLCSYFSNLTKSLTTAAPYLTNDSTGGEKV